MKTNYHAHLIPNNYYHCYNKAPSDRKIFVKDSDCKRFLNKLNKYFSPYLYITAYCLIPNHFHLLIYVREITSETRKSIKKEKTTASRNYLNGTINYNYFLVDQFRRLMSSHALYFNKKYRIQGQLFLKKMKRIHIKSQEKLLDLLCYVHDNPIHHGLVYEYENWLHSSYIDYVENPTKEDYAFILRELGNADIQVGLTEFIQLHKTYKEEYLKDR